MILVKFREELCRLVWGEYVDGSGPSLRLEDSHPGEPVATCTVNLAVKPPTGHVYIKDYSENEGMLAALEAADVVEDTGTRLVWGYVRLPLCRVLVSPPKEGQS